MRIDLKSVEYRFYDKLIYFRFFCFRFIRRCFGTLLDARRVLRSRISLLILHHSHENMTKLKSEDVDRSEKILSFRLIFYRSSEPSMLLYLYGALFSLVCDNYTSPSQYV